MTVATQETAQSKKWIKERYWHSIGSRNWVFLTTEKQQKYRNPIHTVSIAGKNLISKSNTPLQTTGYLTLAAVAKCLQAATWLVARRNKQALENSGRSRPAMQGGFAHVLSVIPAPHLVP
ncbi:MAG: hypothetical protein HFH32_18745 [Eubacterium sp.]|nr:hypothetical protein [Eubacterium sp.]